MKNLFSHQERTIEETAQYWENVSRILFGCVIVLLIVSCVLVVALNIMTSGKL